ncbi:hypothetical protein [Flavobacterium yafengii]|uniref:hypothetical protein n=1 Tax=Flavobacterium yafengii TaxID=3041253 RepID=UPI0024A7BCBE|nr:hypothetical protein [Flavobacterium yafengii]MDI6047543.1 hypothetical protein [Flavobacterium yafengii]
MSAEETPTYQELFKQPFKEDEDESYTHIFKNGRPKFKNEAEEPLPEEFKAHFGWVCRFAKREDLNWMIKKIISYSSHGAEAK